MTSTRTLVPAIVEYVDGRPFTVVLMEPEGAYLAETWDVEWCKRDERMYAHQSGGGGTAVYEVMSRDPKHSRKVYVRPGLPCGVHEQVDGAWVTTPISREELTALGYEFVSTEPEDPFDGAREYPSEDVRCLSCHLCDDWIPADSLCEHLEWCEVEQWWCVKDGEEHVTEIGDRHTITPKCSDDEDEDGSEVTATPAAED